MPCGGVVPKLDATKKRRWLNPKVTSAYAFGLPSESKRADKDHVSVEKSSHTLLFPQAVSFQRHLPLSLGMTDFTQPIIFRKQPGAEYIYLISPTAMD